jgi:hypothetical protein
MDKYETIITALVRLRSSDFWPWGIDNMGGKRLAEAENVLKYRENLDMS